MANKVREFRSLIFRHFDSEAAFARQIGWPRQRLNKITNGEKIPTISELEEFSSPLQANMEDLAGIFLRKKSPYGQHSEDKI